MQLPHGVLADVGWQLPVPSSRREALTAESLCTWPCWVVSTCMRKNRRKKGMRVMRAQSDVEHFISKRPGNISIAKTAAVYIWECVPQNTRLYKCPFSPASSVDPRTSEISMQKYAKTHSTERRAAMVVGKRYRTTPLNPKVSQAYRPCLQSLEV